MDNPFESPPPLPPEAGALTADEKQWAMIGHLSALAGFVVPFGNLIAPLVVWMMKKEESKFIEEHARESLNFQISASIYLIGLSLTICIGIGLVLVPLAVLAEVVLIIMASMKASSGQSYRYPITIRFLNG
jgi:uncharacterized protein